MDRTNFPSQVLSSALYLAAVTSLGFFAGCSDAPQQYSRGLPPQGQWQQGQIPGKIDLEAPELKQADEDDLIREVAAKPIVYGKGAGGITFETTLKEAEKLLPKPQYGPDEEGYSEYASGMAIIWRTDEPRTPNLLILFKGYSGSLKLGGVLAGKTLRIDEPFSDYFTAADPLGKTLANHLYQSLESTPEKPIDPKFDCVAAGICNIVKRGNNNVNFFWPRFEISFSLDRKQVFFIALNKDVNKGKWNTPFDLTQGKFSGAELALGMEWKALKEKSGTDTETSVGASVLSKNFNGIILGLSKSQWTREYREPTDTEKLKTAIFVNGYQQPFLMNSQYVKTKLDPGAEQPVVLSLEEALPQIPQPEPGKPALESVLSLNTGLRGELQKLQLPFLKALLQLAAQQLEAQGQKSAVFQSISGLHSDADVRTFSATALQLKPEQATGRMVRLSLSEKTGNLSSVRVDDLTDPVNAFVIPALVEPARTQTGSLSGFQIGQTVALSEIDLGRGEATVTLTHPNGKTVVTRATYNDSALLTVYKSDAPGKMTSERVSIHAVSVGNTGVTLGLVKKPGKPGDKNNLFVVSSISASILPQGITLQCAETEVAVEEEETAVSVLLTEKDSDVLTRLSEHNTCEHHALVSSTGSKRVTSAVLPQERLIIHFASREASSFTIYQDPREILNSNP